MSEKKLQFDTAENILKAALRKEKASYNFYDNLLKNTKLDIIEEILGQLREEEYKHIHIIEKRLARLELG